MGLLKAMEALQCDAKLKALPKDDFRRKSYGFDLHSINSLLDSLRKQLNRQT